MAAALHRHKNNAEEAFGSPYDHGAMSATTAVKRDSHKGRDCIIDRVFYNNPTGFAASATDYWTIQITDGTNVLASWSTQSTGSGGQGALTADTPVDLVLTTSPAPGHFLAAGLVLTTRFVKTGTPANLPAGTIAVHGRIL